MTLPTFFIIGAPKAGTTSLHSYLDGHPQIQMSAVKEPRFFAGPENGIAYHPARVEALAEYEALFDPAVAVRGESSTDYATHPRRQGVPERIKAMVPEARFVYLVRDPVARTVSHYRMTSALLGERRSIVEALGDLSDRRGPYISASMYATQLELYLRHFPQERMLVLDQADLQSDRRATLAEVFRFLEVDDGLELPGLDDELLGSSRWRSYPVGYADFIARVVAPRFRWVPYGVRKSLRSSVERLLWRPVEADLPGELQERLEQVYAPEVARLRSLTGKAFPSWCV